MLDARPTSLRGKRQVEVKGGAGAGRALDPDHPLVLLDDAVDGGEAEAGALAGLLGGDPELSGLEGLRNIRWVASDDSGGR